MLFQNTGVFGFLFGLLSCAARRERTTGAGQSVSGRMYQLAPRLVTSQCRLARVYTERTGAGGYATMRTTIETISTFPVNN